MFVTTYRGPILDARAHERLREVCAAVEAELDELDGEPDQVRLLVRYRPKIRLAGLVDAFEGVWSRRLRAERFDIGARGPIP